MYKVLITDKINEVAGKLLDGVAQVEYKETLPEDQLAEIIGEYDAIMIRSQTKLTPKILGRAKKLKIAGRAGVGVDNIDVEEATQRGIIVVNSPEGNTTAAAEHTVAMMLSMTRHIPKADLSVKSGKWERSKFTGCEVFNKTLGIIGLGKIGVRVAKAALALGMKVIICDPYVTKEKVEEIGAIYIKSLDDFWPQCDFLTIHVPKTRETAYLINKNTLNRMKPGVRLVNCARGGIIDEQALKEALESGHVASAAIDVFEKEPIDPESPLLHCKGDIILTPHLGASTEEAQINVAIDVAEQIRDVLSGKSARSAVNIPALKAELLEPVKDYMPLAENLGLLIRQISKGATRKIKIVTRGDLAQLDTSPLKVAVLKGILSFNLENVNYVNAPIIAKAQNIEVVDSRSEKTGNFVGLIVVELTTDTETRSVCGAMIADKTPRIVKIDEYNTSVAPAKHILIIPHQDKPGMIAQVATILGRDAVNISMMQVGRKDNTVGGTSIMVINTDDAVNSKLIDEINRIDGIYDAVYVTLNSEKSLPDSLELKV